MVKEWSYSFFKWLNTHSIIANACSELSYNEIISEAKIWILKAIDIAEVVESLDQLEQASEYGSIIKLSCARK